MPLDVVRRAGGAVGGTSRSEDCGSNDTPPRYVAARTDSHTRRWSSTFSARSVRTQTIVDRSAASARPSAARNVSTSCARSHAEPVQRGGVREVEPVRRRHVRLELRPRARDRQEVEDPAAVVVDQHDHQPRAHPRRGQQPADVVRQRDVAGQQHHRPARGERDAERGRDRAVDPVRAAVGEHAERLRADGEERLHVADRHRGRDDQHRGRRQRGAQLGGDPRLGQPRGPHRRGDRARRRAVGRAPVVEPASTGGARPSSPAPRPAPAGRAAITVPTTPDGSCQAPSGSTEICSASDAASHARSGLEVGRSPTRSTSSGACAPAHSGERRSAS